MTEISELLLQQIAGDLERLLVEDRENIDFAYQKHGGVMKVSIGVNLDQTAEGIAVNYDIGYDLEPKPVPPEKHKVKYRHVIDDGTLAMDFLGKEIRDGKMSIEVNGVRVGNVNVE